MGTWGVGAFDSDDALDYLESVATRVANFDDDGEIIAGSVDHDAARQRLHGALDAALAGSGEPNRIAAYAAAGLVAAVVTGQGHANTGSRLGSTLLGADLLDPVGLSAHCGLTALLTMSDAKALQPVARQVTEALIADTAWIAQWSPGIGDALTQLQAALS